MRLVQFSLRSLFIMIGLECVIIATLVQVDPATVIATLPISTGVLVWCFVLAHTGRALGERLGMLFVVAGWGAFAISLFLPAASTFEQAGGPPGAPAKGWSFQLFDSVSGIVILLVTMADMLTGWTNLKKLDSLAPLWLIPIPWMNLVASLSPVIVWKPSWPRYVFFFACASIIVAFLLPTDIIGRRFVGFHLWHMSYLLTAVGTASIWMAEKRVRGARGHVKGIAPSELREGGRDVRKQIEILP